MGKLRIYRASAGSGKTFTLAVAYIRLVIESPENYRHILAVTFTNKATAEMKERILSQLYGIAYGLPESDAYFAAVQQALPLQEGEIRQRAAQALTQILHNFSFFHVETIDSFFQTVMRYLAHELQLSTNLNVELNAKEAIDEAVDVMLEQLTDHSPAIHWILDAINEKIDNNSGWNVVYSLKKFANNLFDENYRACKNEIEKQLADPHFIRNYKQLLNELEEKEQTRMKTYAETFFDSLEESGLTIDDFSYGKTGGITFFIKLRNGEYSDKVLTTRTLTFIDSPDNWGKKKSTPEVAATLAQYVSDEWWELMKGANEARQKAYEICSTCQAIRKHLTELQLLNTIHKTLDEENRKANRFLLSDTPKFLNDIIQDADASFIFEKVGTQFKYIMIDEFQDTSRMQWNNFKPLLVECLANDYSSLIVGDIKQSIYRWRNGDWTILANMKKELPQGTDIEDESLSVNRRSEAHIIRFNNDFFRRMVNYLTDEQTLPINTDAIHVAYNDVEQLLLPHKPERGYVRVELLGKQEDEESDYDTQTYERLVDTVTELREKGVELKDIAMLVRRKKHIPDIAAYFAEHLPDVPIVSAEAFRLEASIGVNLIVNALRLLNNREDKMTLLLIADTYQNAILKHPCTWDELCSHPQPWELLPAEFVSQYEKLNLFPIYELIERVMQFFHIETLTDETSYLFFFLDEVMEYLRKEPSDIVSFIHYWDETLSAKNIPSGEVEGIRIHSIHASKGLEFNTVLIPFCDWPIDHSGDTLWCLPQQAPFNQLQVTPIEYSAKLAGSIFTNAYETEKLQQLIDNVNLLYVAFTRAKTNLYVFGKQPTEKKSSQEPADSFKTVSDLLYNVLQTNKKESEAAPFVYEVGTLYIPPKKEAYQGANPLLAVPMDKEVGLQSKRHPLTFRQSNRSQAFFAPSDDKKQQYLQQGLLLHYLFSNIQNANDVDRILQQFECNGFIGSTISRQQIQQFVDRGLSNPQVSEWFEPDWQVMNECTILKKVEGVVVNRRPDRVIVKPNRTIVIDFKFGTPQAAYADQVRTYMQLLGEMGYPQIEGYLWYVYSNKVETVKA